MESNKEKGITLIALVVTIIVLLILAGISIAMLTGDNGILTNAKKAKVETRGVAVEEARDIWKATKETDKLANSTTAQTLEELINDLVKQKQLTEDEKDKILGNEEKGIEAEYEITIGSRTIEFDIIHFTVDGVELIAYSGETWVEWLQRNANSDIIPSSYYDCSEGFALLRLAIRDYIAEGDVPKGGMQIYDRAGTTFYMKDSNENLANWDKEIIGSEEYEGYTTG